MGFVLLDGSLLGGSWVAISRAEVGLSYKSLNKVTTVRMIVTPLITPLVTAHELSSLRTRSDKRTRAHKGVTWPKVAVLQTLVLGLKLF